MAAAPAVKSAYAYEEIRTRIADGRLAPGTRLRLRALGEELGLSEMPVREALRMLQRDGMVEIQDHRGATVTEVSLEAVIDHVSTRMWLEALAVETSTPQHTARSLKAAETAFGRVERAAAAGDSAAFSVANRAFHEVLEQFAGPSAGELIQSLWDIVWLARRQRSLFGYEPGRMLGAQVEHRDLLDAIRAGDAAGAREVMLRHRAKTLNSWSALIDRAAAAHG